MAKKETKTSILTEKSLVDVSNASDSSEVIKKIEDKGITTTRRGYVILQQAAVNWLRHYEKHGNINVVNHFMERVRVAQFNPQKMGEYLMKYAPLGYDISAKAFFRLENSNKTFDIAGAMANPWWKTGKPQQFTPFNFEKALAQLMARAKKRKDEDKEGDVFNQSLYDKVFRIASEYDLFDDDDSLNGDEPEVSTSEDESEMAESVESESEETEVMEAEAA